MAITFTDMRRRGLIDKMVLVDAVGERMPAVRDTMARKIGAAYKDMDLTMTTLPADDVAFDPQAFRAAISLMNKGDVVTIFTPDDTHFEIALACVEAGLHVLCAKPIVKRLEDHLALAAAAKKHGVLCAVEYHKRFDPIYVDARDRARAHLGPFSFFSSTMTQPKAQLDTFRGWAGKSSDISYYLNSHHMDLHTWFVGRSARPERVVAHAARGAAEARLEPDDGRVIEDTVSLTAQWRNDNGSVGVATYVASWIAPKADCHTQQYFHYMGHRGEIRVDQGHRGYTMSTDDAGFTQLNPLYMKYTGDGRDVRGPARIRVPFHRGVRRGGGRRQRGARDGGGSEREGHVGHGGRHGARHRHARGGASRASTPGDGGCASCIRRDRGSGTVPSNPSGWNWSERETGSGAKGVAPSVRGCDVGAS